MKKKVFLDTNIIYKLSFIAKHSDCTDEELKQIMLFSTDPEYIDGRMQKNSVAVDKTIQLYHDIENGKVEPCICSTVYCEVLNKNVKENKELEKKRQEAEEHGTEFKEQPTIKEYLYKYFTLYAPENEFRKEYISHVYALQNGLKQNSVKIGEYYYGLNDEVGYDHKPHSDYDDRCIISELAVLSQYTDEKIKVINLQTLNDEEGLIKYIYKLHGNIVNEQRKTQHDNYDVYPTAKEIIYYHFNQSDYGSRIKNEAMNDEGHKKATELENNIQSQVRKSTVKNHELNIEIQHISEYEREF